MTYEEKVEIVEKARKDIVRRVIGFGYDHKKEAIDQAFGFLQGIDFAYNDNELYGMLAVMWADIYPEILCNAIKGKTWKENAK